MTKYYCDICDEECPRPKEYLSNRPAASFRSPSTTVLQHKGLTLEYLLLKGDHEVIFNAGKENSERADICRRCLIEMIDLGKEVE